MKRNSRCQPPGVTPTQFNVRTNRSEKIKTKQKNSATNNRLLSSAPGVVPTQGTGKPSKKTKRKRGRNEKTKNKNQKKRKQKQKKQKLPRCTEVEKWRARACRQQHPSLRGWGNTYFGVPNMNSETARVKRRGRRQQNDPIRTRCAAVPARLVYQVYRLL